MAVSEEVRLTASQEPQWKRAETYCQRHFDNSVRDLGWEDYIARALAAGEDVELVCASLGEDYDLDDLTRGIWATRR